MSRQGKVAVVVALVVTAGFATLAWRLGQQLPGGGGWLGRARQIEQAADHFAAEHDASDCIDKANELAEPCPRLLVFCATRANVFAWRCLSKAAPDPAVCVGVPPPEDVFGTRDWGLERCGRRGRDEACGAIAATLQKHCYGG